MLGYATWGVAATLGSMTGTAPAAPFLYDDNVHRHGTACWWDHREAHMVCPPAPDADRRPVTERPLVDVRDMVVVHTAMLREFRLAAQAVARVPAGARRSGRRAAAHLELLCDLLHHHHTGEDELLWPPLRAVLPTAGQALLDDAEDQHAGLDQALDHVGAARSRWIQTLEPSDRDELVAALATLHELLTEHLDAEEKTLLPLAAAHLTQAQWAAVGRAGAAAVPKSKLLLVFGMFSYEGDPAVIAAMLNAAPPPVRMIVPIIAPRVYARSARRLVGTSRP